MSGLVEYLMDILQPLPCGGWSGLYGDSIFPVAAVIFRCIKTLETESEILRDQSKHKILKDKNRAMRLGV
eukprot:13393359-Ditylum_brightwellii.AAC.1